MMTEQEHYSLRWNNHQNHILRAFDALLQTKTLVDVTLVCAETSIRAHKVVLSACSPFFQNVFAENPCKHPVIVLKDFAGWVVQAIVDFMYRGEISVPQERLQILIQAGESLQIRGLVDHSISENATGAPLTVDLSRIAGNSEDFIAATGGSSHTTTTITTTTTDRHHQQQLSHTSKYDEALLELKRTQQHLLRPNERDHQRTTPAATTHQNDNNNRETNCTSPMPRRKQARPRRRSGECGPHDLTSKPSSPNPFNVVGGNGAAANPDPTQSTAAESNTQPILKERNKAAVLLKKRNKSDRFIEHSQYGLHLRAADDRLSDCRRRQTPAAAVAVANILPPNDASDDLGSDMDEEEMDEGRDDDIIEHDEFDEEDEEEMDGEEEEEDDAEDGPENLCIKNTINNNNSESSWMEALSRRGRNSDTIETGGGGETALPPADVTSKMLSNTEITSKMQSGSGGGGAGSGDVVNGLSLKDIRHLNRPPTHCRQNPFPSAAAAAHIDYAVAAAAAHQQNLLLTGGSNMDEKSPYCMRPSAIWSPTVREHRERELQREQREHRERDRERDREREREHRERENDRENSEQRADASAAAANAQFLQQQADNMMKREALETRLENESPYLDRSLCNFFQLHKLQSEIEQNPSDVNRNQQEQPQQQQQQQPHSAGNVHHPNSRHHDIDSNLHKDFTPSSPMSLPSHFNAREGPPHPPSPLQFPGMSSALTLTPPHHMFGLDSPLPLFPPGMDPGKLYNPLMEMSDPRSMHPHHHGPYLKKKGKLSRPKGQHSAPRGGPPRSWTNAELTEALHHVWNKKMTTSQASRLFGIPYNSLLMYVRGKYGKSLNLEQLRKGCISGPPIELLTMGLAANTSSSKGGGGGLSSSRSSKELKDLDDGPHDGGRASGSGSMKRSSSSEPDLLSNPNAMFNPFPASFYSDFASGFPGLPLSMLNLLPPERHPPTMHNMQIDEDCKSDRSKQSLEDDYQMPQSLAMKRDDRRELIQQNGQE